MTELLRLSRTFVSNGSPLAGYLVAVSRSGGNSPVSLYADSQGLRKFPASTLTTDSNGTVSAYVQAGEYRLTVLFPGSGVVIQTEDGIRPEGVGVESKSPDEHEDDQSDLMGWALVQAFRIVSATRNNDGAVTTASIVWPDGAAGTFTATTLSTAFLGAIDGWSATYVRGGTTKTVTQPAVTRNVEGAVTAQPAIAVT